VSLLDDSERTGGERPRRRVDLVALAFAAVALWGAGFFLVADDPSLRDQAGVLWPVALIVAGIGLVLATARR
jgi:hypothetical protein